MKNKSAVTKKQPVYREGKLQITTRRVLLSKEALDDIVAAFVTSGSRPQESTLKELEKLSGENLNRVFEPGKKRASF